MPISVNSTGRMSIPQWTATGAFEINWKGKFLNTGNQVLIGNNSSSDSYIYLINAGTRLRMVIATSVAVTINFAGVSAGDVIEVTASRDGSNSVSMSITVDGTTYTSTNTNQVGDVVLDSLGDRAASLRFAGEAHYLSLTNGTDDREYVFAGASGATTVSNSAAGALVATDASLVSDADFSGIQNPLFHTLETTMDSITGDGVIVSTRADVDNASTLFFTRRSYLAAYIRAYDSVGDVNYLDYAIAYANNFLNLRDDIYAANGGTVFTGAQTGYRSAPPSIYGTNSPAAVWSYDFTDTAANGNPEAEGRRAEVLTTARTLSILAEIVVVYFRRKPTGSYTPPSGAEAGILSGTYSSIVNDLMFQIDKTARIFDGLWQSDYTGRIGPTSAGTSWTVSGSYFYPSRQNLSINGLDADNVLPWNHASGMLYARMVISRFGGYDPSAVDHFQRWYSFFESVYKSDEPSIANAGLADIGGDIFGLQADGSYSWNYVCHEAFPEDVDHALITIEVMVLAYRFGLLSRSTLTPLIAAFESLYHADSSAIYDRIHDTSNGNYTAFPRLAGTAALLSDSTNVLTEFADLMNATRPSGTLHIREDEAVATYHYTDTLSEYLFEAVVYDGSATSGNSIVDQISERHGDTLIASDTIYLTAIDGVTYNTDGTATTSLDGFKGWYYYDHGGATSAIYQFNELAFKAVNQITNAINNLRIQGVL